MGGALQNINKFGHACACGVHCIGPIPSKVNYIFWDSGSKGLAPQMTHSENDCFLYVLHKYAACMCTGVFVWSRNLGEQYSIAPLKELNYTHFLQLGALIVF